MSLNATATLTEKRCSMCFEMKPISKFGINQSRLDGRRSECKSCRSIKRCGKERVKGPLTQIKTLVRDFKDKGLVSKSHAFDMVIEIALNDIRC